jgi:phytoene desaturase
MGHRSTRCRYRELALDQLSREGLSDVRSRIITERMITPLDWHKDFGLYRGATFNLAHNLGQMLHKRPHNRFEDLENVFLVGGGTHPGSGLPVIYESSRITCKQLIPQLGLDDRFLYEFQTESKILSQSRLAGVSA